MPVLHLVIAPTMVRQCLGRAQAGDAILLIGNGVYAALRESEACGSLVSSLKEGVGLYCLGPDLDTRGISPKQLIDRADAVDYDGFVDLAVRFPQTCSW